MPVKTTRKTLKRKTLRGGMHFKEFAILLEGPHQPYGGYGETHKIIINENDIYQVRFQPSPQGPYKNPIYKYSAEQTLHDMVGQELGERTLVYHSERPFRIEDLAHTIQPLDSIAFWESTTPTMSTRRILDIFIEEVKYRQAKNDRIEELEQLVAELSKGVSVRKQNSSMKAAEDVVPKKKVVHRSALRKKQSYADNK